MVSERHEDVQAAEAEYRVMDKIGQENVFAADPLLGKSIFHALEVGQLSISLEATEWPSYHPPAWQQCLGRK